MRGASSVEVLAANADQWRKHLAPYPVKPPTADTTSSVVTDWLYSAELSRFRDAFEKLGGVVAAGVVGHRCRLVDPPVFSMTHA